MLKTKEERIRKRRELLKRQLSNDEDQPLTTSSSEEDRSKHAPLRNEQQIAESVSHLQRVKNEQLNEIASFRIDTDRREAKRRVEHEHSRKEYMEITKAEIESNVQGPETCWASMSNEDDLLRFHEGMEMMKSAYDEIIERKSELIDSLKSKLLLRDELFLTGLSEQETTATKLRELSAKELEALDSLYMNELKSIKEAFREDRKNMIGGQASTLASLANTKSAVSEESLDAMRRRKESKEENVLETHDLVVEKYNKMRNRLQEQVTELERELSMSKGIYSGEISLMLEEKISQLIDYKTIHSLKSSIVQMTVFNCKS